MRKFISISLIAIISNIALAQQLNWHHLGGPMGGTVGDMAIDSKGNIYAGVYTNVFTNQTYEGIYKSTDNGESWFKLENTVDQFEVYALYINKEDHIYAGTNYRDRLYRSSDGGESWEVINNGYNTSECWAIGENKDGSVLFAGDGQFGKLYRSTNNGALWEISADLPVLSFAVDSSNNIYCGTFTGLYKSTDDGISWIEKSLAGIPVNTIIVDDSNGVYCGTGYYSDGHGVYYSSDHGESWSSIGLEDKIVLSLAITSTGKLLAGTSIDGVYATTDKGENWVQYNDGLFHKQVFRLKVNSRDDIFIGSEYEGIFRSTNSGISFEMVGLPISGVYNIDFMEDSLIIAGTVTGVQKYNRITGEWENIGLQAVLAVETDEEGNILAATNGGGLFESTDKGKSWNNICQSPYVLNVKKINQTILAATDTGLIRSTDNGITWESTPVRSGVDLNAIEVNNNGDIWTVGFRKLFKSTDNGLSFDSSETINFSIVTLNRLYVNNELIFLGEGLMGRGIHFSTDYGKTWKNKFQHRGTISVDGKDNFILYSSNKDLLFSLDRGTTWDSVPYPPDFYGSVTEIEFDKNGKLFFGTSSNGLFEMDFITNAGKEELITRRNFFLSQNYPNPFNPVTNISYTISEKQFVTLKVYDVLGNEITVLVNEEKPAGEYEVTFVASGLSSGIYFYRLTVSGDNLHSSNFTETKSMILLK